MARGGHDIPVSGTHLKGTHEVVTKGVDPTYNIGDGPLLRSEGRPQI